MEEKAKDHAFDEFPEGDVVHKLIRAKWVGHDRGEQARERLVAMEIAASEGKRDDNHLMTPPQKWHE